MTTLTLPIKLSSGVQRAMAEHRAVLAMESTVLTHGLPYPDNFKVLEELERLCIDNGVEPATIIVLDGIAHIGMDEADIANLRDKMQNREQLHKFGRRDLPIALIKGLSGGTTVSATMLLAYYSGIKVFSTGGIGGVHRGWERTLDISSDLKALAEIPVIVVSAGCKAILDIPATLEYLETVGVPVIGWQTHDFPAFYSRKSGLKIDKVDSAKQLADIYKTMMALDAKSSGIILANPVPHEHEIPKDMISIHIEKAIQTAMEQGVGGKDLTPFLLSFLAESTQGLSVSTNLALLKNNVIIGAQIAKELV